MKLSLTMIVKNEEEYLTGCLQSVQGIADEIIVVDTGSDDRTVEIARSFGARVLARPWRHDFAWARNQALRAATGEWALVLDADERFVGEAHKMRKAMRQKGVVAFQVPIRSDILGQPHIHSAVRLFRLVPGVSFERRLHEQVLPSLVRVFPRGQIRKAPFLIEHLGYQPDVIEKRDKRTRNLELAKAEVSAHPDDGFGIFSLGVELMGLGQTEEAVETFDKALSISPPGESWQNRLYRLLTEALLALKKWDDARIAAERGIHLFSGFTDLHYLRGVAVQQLGQWDEAEAAYRKCIEMGPAPSPPYDGVDPHAGAGSAYYCLGCVLAQKGEVQAAQQALLEATRLRPGWMPIIQTLVDLALGEEGGLAALLAASPPPDPLAVGAVLFRMRRFEDALTAFRRGEGVYKSLPGDHYLVKAMAFLRLGDLEGAEQSVKEAGSKASLGSRAFVGDAVAFRRGRLDRTSLDRKYPPGHEIWHLLQEAPGA